MMVDKVDKRDDFYNVLRLHAALYPAMEPADAVKLAYQSVFGGGHLIADAAEGLRRLTEERRRTCAGAAAERVCAVGAAKPRTDEANYGTANDAPANTTAGHDGTTTKAESQNGAANEATCDAATKATCSAADEANRSTATARAGTTTGCDMAGPQNSAANEANCGTVTKKTSPAAFTPIGGKFARLELAAAALSPLPDELLFRMFYLSAQRPTGNNEAFSAALDALRAAAAEGVFAFPVSALDAYLAVCRAGGCPMVSHSETYRRAYRPAYRVIDAAYAELFPLILRLAALQERGRPAAVAIDGQAAAGKTTAAARLSELFCAPVVHMDDFYLPPDVRTQQRLAEPGGNVHCERFIAEVLPHLSSGAAFSYRVFDCGRAAYAETRDIPASQLILVEGAYSLHPAFGNPYAATAFFAISTAEQERRIRARNGDAVWERFRDVWIPMENRYHDAFGIRAHCGDVIEVGGM